jgi:hypothetical protein
MKCHSIARAVVAPLIWCTAASLAFAADAPPSAPRAQQGLRRYIYSLHPDGSQGAGAGEGQRTRGENFYPDGKPKDLLDGLVVLDIDNGCSFVKRIPLPCLAGTYGGYGARGIAGHTATKRIYYTFMLAYAKVGPKNRTIVGCVDVETDKVLWEALPGSVGAGNPVVSLDGRKLYVSNQTGPALVLNTADGSLLKTIKNAKSSHNAHRSPDGRYVYMGGDSTGTKIDTTTDEVVGTFPGLHWHFVVDRTGKWLYATWKGAMGPDPSQAEMTATGTSFCAAKVYDAQTGQWRHSLRLPLLPGPRNDFPNMSHEGSFNPGGTRFWTQPCGGGVRGLTKDDDRCVDLGVATARKGGWNVLTEWDITRDPPCVVKFVTCRSDPHSHGHALVSREGDLVFTGNGLAIDTKTYELKGTWKDAQGRWFQGTKFMQVNFRDGKVDWVGQRHGVGWLYDVPALSEGKHECNKNE